MPFHRELFKDLPPAEDIRKSYEHARRTHKDADGYYALVQDIAAKYGAKAYELAEAVFREMELEYDPSDLRTPGKIRRAGYAFDGGNIYDIEVRPFEPAMIKGVVRCYRNVFRHVSTAALIDEPYFENRILADPNCGREGLLIAFNADRMTLGFVHCCADASNSGTIEAFAFYPGRMHEHVGPALLSRAAAFFTSKGVREIRVFGHVLKYPYYDNGGNLRAELSARLGYLHDALAAAARQFGWSWS